MHKIIKYFYENKLTILTIISAIIIVFAVIQLLNKYYENTEKELQNEAKENIDSSNSATIDNSDYLISKDNTVSKTRTKNIENIMKNFVNYCNSKQFENAYNMLTDECKQVLFSTQEDFVQKYANKIFNDEKIYTIQAWDEDENENTITYDVHFMQDPLATGKSDTFIQEYYTFVEQNGTYKININNFINSKKYNNLIETSDEADIDLQILSSETFKDYTTYEFKIINNTKNTIWVNGDKSRSKVFLKGNNGTTYSAIQSEFNQETPILIQTGNSRIFRIKFNKVYESSYPVDSLVINDIILNYNEYMQNQDNYEDRIQLEVNL